MNRQARSKEERKLYPTEEKCRLAIGRVFTSYAGGISAMEIYSSIREKGCTQEESIRRLSQFYSGDVATRLLSLLVEEENGG